MSQGGEKTEKATPKKRRDAREKGQVLKSQEVNTAVCMLAIFGFMLLYAKNYVDAMVGVFQRYLGESFLLWGMDAINGNNLSDMAPDVILQSLLLVGPVLGIALLAGVGANLMQVGFMFTTKTLAPQFDRISFLKGLKRLFSLQSVVQLLKSLLKVIVLAYIFYGDYEELLAAFPGFMGQDAYRTLVEVLKTAFMIALKMSLAMAAIAAADFMYQFLKYEKDLKMTKQEIKDEYKLTEGDPQIKGKIRQKQRQMSAMRMMSQVPQADVVITNPTHFAVALKYDESGKAAPVVLAKGHDHMARKIKEVARAHRIEIVEDKPLAQSLYAMCEVGDEIPEQLYKAVAEVLAYVYRQKNRHRRPTRPPRTAGD